MDILKALHVSVAEACEASFDTAYRDLESQLASHEARLKEANNNASLANEARQAAEHRVQELQQEVLTLQKELNDHDSSSADIALPSQFADLQGEFAPEHVWGNGPHSVDQLRRILETKYTALYTNLQTLTEGWNGLKSKVGQHKKKLRHWERQVRRDKFTFMLDGAPVTFQRIHREDTGVEKTIAPPLDTNRERQLQSEPRSFQASHFATKPARAVEKEDSISSRPKIKMESNSQHGVHAHPSEPVSRRSPSPSHDLVAAESSSDTLHPLPDVHGRKRRRIQQTSHAHPPKANLQRPVQVKNEPMSSSPIQPSTHFPGQSLPSTQDLDDIGDTVQTPTKQHARQRTRWEYPAPESESSHAATPQAPSGQFSQQASVLGPTDGNTKVPQSTEYGKHELSDAAALSMAEDGDTADSDDQSKHNSRRTPAPHTASSIKGKGDTGAVKNRLRGLLEGSTPSKSPLGTFKTGRDVANRTPKTVEHSSGRHPLQPDEAAPEIRPEDEPYRLWPLHRLNLDHFKINSTRNQGLDFAYDSVIRKKDERKCLSGCTRPGCCGDRFRAMARLGGPSANPTAEQAEQDQRILEEYVGDDQRYLKQLNAQEREGLLIEARARAMANQYGRHRHNHQRAQSPPGFWRTDMPSTQEMESDREAAQRQEREKVEERYREAMRPGGMWIFADE